MVLNRIGHSAAYTASVILVSGPNPSSTSASGISATEGIGRRNSMTARVACRTAGTLPSTSPLGTAMATAITMAISTASNVATT